MSGDGTPSRHAIGRGFRTVEMLPGGKCNWPQPVFGRKRAGANVAAATPSGPHSPWRTWSVLLAADASVAPSELWVHGISWCLNCVDQQNRTTSTTPADHNARPNTAGPGITERPIDGGDKAGLCLQTVPDNPN